MPERTRLGPDRPIPSSRRAPRARPACAAGGPVILVSALAVLALPEAGRAQTAPATVTVRVIFAHNAGGGIDTSLGSISGQLRSRFGQYSSFRQEGQSRVSIPEGASRTVRLPSGRSATIRFDGMEGSAYRITVALPGGSTTVTSPRGGVFFVPAGQQSGGLLILAIRT